MKWIWWLMTLVGGTLAFSSDTAPNSTREDCDEKIEKCLALGSELSGPLCGSDGVTYANHCELLSKQCLGVTIAVKHSGPCHEAPPCLLERRNSRPGSRPVCRPDGTYASVQCHTDTGLCWCVTPQGRPIPNTSLRHERPRCPPAKPAAIAKKSAKKFNPGTRSGPSSRSRLGPSWKQRSQFNSDRRKSSCDRNERARFNGNLIDVFKIEYGRVNSTYGSDKSLEPAVTWKFKSLDRNNDGYLDKSEYKELRRLAKKAVRPKKCARSFARTCDANRDIKLSLQEWGSCLLMSDGSSTLKEKESTAQARPSFSDEATEASDDTDVNDCLSDRKSVLEDQRQNSQEKFYIPECTPDGRYHKVQCYSGYCWCVYQDTGKPIPGTSSKNRTPNCNPVPAAVRTIKGCPDGKKQLFLRDLMELLQRKMKASNSDPDGAGIKWPASKEERIATWHFVMLDKNKNKVLERREWKSFRAMVANNRQLRRCGKKLPRYCDINNDRRISMTEWLSCLNAQRPTTADSSSAEKISTSKPRRMGPNPLDQFLNDDD